MSFTYSLSLRKNPLKPLLSPKAYAKAQASKVCGFDTVCHRIADRSSATAGDVKLVLDDFGRFQGQISGGGRFQRNVLEDVVGILEKMFPGCGVMQKRFAQAFSLIH